MGVLIVWISQCECMLLFVNYEFLCGFLRLLSSCEAHTFVMGAALWMSQCSGSAMFGEVLWMSQPLYFIVKYEYSGCPSAVVVPYWPELSGCPSIVVIPCR